MLVRRRRRRWRFDYGYGRRCWCGGGGGGGALIMVMDGAAAAEGFLVFNIIGGATERSGSRARAAAAELPAPFTYAAFPPPKPPPHNLLHYLVGSDVNSPLSPLLLPLPRQMCDDTTRV